MAPCVTREDVFDYCIANGLMKKTNSKKVAEVELEDLIEEEELFLKTHIRRNTFGQWSYLPLPLRLSRKSLRRATWKTLTQTLARMATCKGTWKSTQIVGRQNHCRATTISHLKRRMEYGVNNCGGRLMAVRTVHIMTGPPPVMQTLWKAATGPLLAEITVLLGLRGLATPPAVLPIPLPRLTRTLWLYRKLFICGPLLTRRDFLV